MAQVDFSNAVLEPNTGQKPLDANNNLKLSNSYTLYDSNNNPIVSSSNMTKLISSPNLVTILYTGTFARSGTEFYLGISGYYCIWKVTNITFASGDTYSFAVDIETTIK